MKNQGRKTQQVLFLCTGNYYRSRFAEIYFNWLADQRGLLWIAESRGLALNVCNNGPISYYTVTFLKSRGIRSEAYDRYPLQVGEADLVAADRIVAVKETEHRPVFETNFPAWGDRIEYWQVHDIDCATPGVAIPQLEQEVIRLIERLATQRMIA